MIARDGRHHVRIQAMAVVVTLSALALAIPARAGDAPEPIVVADKSALPRDCVSLRNVSGRHLETPPRPERAQADGVWEAKQKGATHVVTESLGPCGGHEYCYSGVAYRCPAPGSPSPGK
jgi:hypothetical protein